MAGGASFPDWDAKVEAIKKWVCWATRANGDWYYRDTYQGTPQPNEPYFQLLLRRLVELGVPEVQQIDLENPPANPCVPLPNATQAEPRAEMVVSNRLLHIDLRVHSYDQNANQAAWAVADATRSRMRMRTPRDRFLSPCQISLVETFQVIHMPNRARAEEGDRDKPTPTDDHFYSEALLELKLATVVAETDNSAVGTWIERTEVSSNLLHGPGNPLAPVLQLDDVPMGLPIS